MVKKTKKPAKKQTKPTPQKKKQTNMLFYALLGLLAVLVVFLFLSEPRVEQPPVADKLALSGCVFAPDTGRLECGIEYNGQTCTGDITLAVFDRSNRTMLAVKSDSFGIGYIDLGSSKLTGLLTAIQDEAAVDGSSPCGGVVLTCDDAAYSSSCTFV